MVSDDLHARIASVKDDVIHWRRYLHAHPELTFNEFETAKYNREQLSQVDNLTGTQLTPNSVQAYLKGARPGKKIALRADIDALPLTENSGEAFSSTNPGVMHACGHDAHTAMLLGAVKVLCGMQDQIAGEVVFIFQHAEEVPPGGAQDLVDKGVLDGVDMIFGMHVWPAYNSSQIMVKPGIFSASSDNFDITIQGRGAHGSMPHLSIDPIVVGSAVVTALQTIVARRLDPLTAPVLTVATFQSGDHSYNVIPNSVRLAGTLRTHNKDVRAKVRTMFEETLAGTCAAYGAGYDLDWKEGYTIGDNDAGAVAIAREVAEKYLPSCTLHDMPAPMFGSEDFSSYQEKVPGCFMFVGAGNPEIGAVHGLHNPQFKLDEDVMKTGVSLHVGLVHHLLMNQN